jgi:hypothetical protein
MEYSAIVKNLGVEGLFGFARYPGDGFTGRVEVGIGRTNINLTPTQVGKLSTLTFSHVKSNIIYRARSMQLGKLERQHGFSQKILLSMAVDVFVQNSKVCMLATTNT